MTRGKHDLEQEVAQLRAAAGSAADAARQNLLTPVEARIKELNAALGVDTPAPGAAAGLPKTIPAAAPAAGTGAGRVDRRRVRARGANATARPAVRRPRSRSRRPRPRQPPRSMPIST